MIGVPGLLLGVSLLPTAVAIAGDCFPAAAVPIALVFRNYALVGQIVFGAVALAAVLSGLLHLVAWLAPGEFISNLALGLLASAAIGVVLCTWTCNIPGLVILHDRD